MVIEEIQCKSILTKSRISGIDYALNPYVGCGHGCRYCYADFMRRFTGHTEPWGGFVDVKANAPQVLSKQLKRLTPGLISLGTVTDGYQPAERENKISRRCLEELAKYEFPLSVLTKSSLVLRDVDLLRDMKEVDVGFTITTLDEVIRKVFEPNSSSVRERLNAIRELSDAGIKTWVFFGPVLPYFADSEEVIDRLFSEALSAGVNHVLVDTLNLYPKVWNRVKKVLSSNYPEALDTYMYYHGNKLTYQEELRVKIAEVGARYGIPYRFAF